MKIRYETYLENLQENVDEVLEIAYPRMLEEGVVGEEDLLRFKVFDGKSFEELLRG